MVRVILGEPEVNQRTVVPSEFEGTTQTCDINAFLNSDAQSVAVPAIYGSFDKILTKEGMYNVFKVAFAEKRAIYIPLQTHIVPHSFKSFLMFLASLEDEVTLIIADTELHIKAKETMQGKPGFINNGYSLLLIDLHNFLHRSYHSFPEKRDDQGNIVTLKAALYALIKWIEVSPYTHVAFCADSLKSLRKEYTQALFLNDLSRIYKANRKRNDASLDQQILDCYSYIAGWGFKTVTISGYEADDVVASLVNEFKNVPVHVLSNDKDFCGLFTYRNFKLLDKDRKVLTSDYVNKKFGITPELFLDFQALTGDSADNVSGIKGVGEKFAAKLLNEFGSLNGVLENASKIKGKLGEAIANGRDDALLSYDLLRMRNNLLQGYDFESLRIRKGI